MSPAQIFWVIKHGVRMTAMPAWGKSHDDPSLWAMVAFIKYKLPTMSAGEFDQIVPEKEAAEDNAGHMAMEHMH